jgi:Protein of unknown function (DUF2778)
MKRDNSASSFSELGSDKLSRRIMLAAIGGFLALAVSAGALAFILNVPLGAPRTAAAPEPLPLLPSMALASAERPSPLLVNPAPYPLGQAPATVSSLAARPLPATPSKPTFSPALEAAPMPPPRPAALASPATAPSSVMRLADGGAGRASPGDVFGIAGRYDRFTAVYDLTAHTVYLPDGTKLEAHSGLGDRLDDPHHVDEHDRGATPPHLYDLTLREEPFHGVQALRLNPVGGGIFGRAGLLAHTYMLGPNGDSNGCVSFKNYDAFLQAYQSGQVKRLAVVAALN